MTDHPSNPSNPSDSPDARHGRSDRDQTIVSLSDTGRNFSSADELAAGTKVGKYQVRGLLGRGGMGTVYAAVDSVLRREVALKILPRELTEDEQALKRFVREAQLAARLNHANAVTVFDVGRKNTTYFIAMELVRGQSVEQLIRASGALGVAEATRIVADACRALAAAHAAGLIHRDIKPANILRADDGSVKLSDFGLAKLGNSAGVTITEKNVVLGTPHYMSPEQCQNEPVDARSDIYALGASYFALLTGRSPYTGNTAMQVLFAHCTKPVPDPRESAVDVPPACTQIIRKAMAKRPEDRYATAAQMLADLEAVLASRPLAAPPSPTPAAANPPAPPAEPSALDEIAGALQQQARHAPRRPVGFDPPVARPSRRRPPSPLKWAAIGAGSVVLVILGLLGVRSILNPSAGPEGPQPSAAADLHDPHHHASAARPTPSPEQTLASTPPLTPSQSFPNPVTSPAPADLIPAAGPPPGPGLGPGSHDIPVIPGAPGPAAVRPPDDFSPAPHRPVLAAEPPHEPGSMPASRLAAPEPPPGRAPQAQAPERPDDREPGPPPEHREPGPRPDDREPGPRPQREPEPVNPANDPLWRRFFELRREALDAWASGDRPRIGPAMRALHDFAREVGDRRDSRYQRLGDSIRDFLDTHRPDRPGPGFNPADGPGQRRNRPNDREE